MSLKCMSNSLSRGVWSFLHDLNLSLYDMPNINVKAWGASSCDWMGDTEGKKRRKGLSFLEVDPMLDEYDLSIMMMS